MKQILLLSGKGGTGKTTLAAAFVRLAQAQAVADCDVDAPNLHFVVQMTASAQIEPFYGMEIASIDPALCSQCGLCVSHCRFEAIADIQGEFVVDGPACEGCGVCVAVCPTAAARLVPDIAGELRLQQDATTVFSTARLKMGKGNSGLLVTEVKKRLRDAAPSHTPLAIIDGSPGIGCPVIASLNGVDLVLMVAEPSLSGLSDLGRVVESARRFGVVMAVCINKYDASLEHTRAIRAFCRERAIPLAGEIPYDPSVVVANNNGQSIVDADGPSAMAIRGVFAATMKLLTETGTEPSASSGRPLFAH